MKYRSGWTCSVVLVVLCGCSLERLEIAGGGDAGIVRDAAPIDAGDAGGIVDAGMLDAGMFDGGELDGGQDAGPLDAGQDAGPLDAGCTGAPMCSGDSLVSCVGGGLVTTPCALGCSAGACRAVVPSNVGGSVSFGDGTAALDVADGELWLVYPDTGLIEARSAATPATVLRNVRAEGVGTSSGIRYAQVAGSSGASYGVFVFGSLRVRANGLFVGNAFSTRALVLVSAGDVLIEGYVAVRGSAFGPGPAAGAGGAAEMDGQGDGHGDRGASGGIGSLDDGGGGGASYGTRGGAGGNAPSQTGGAAGGTYGNAELVPLRGGSGGGGGGDDDGGRGGHGGGAIQISSATQITVTASGQIDACGEGGRGGVAATDSGAGGGGGSGGAILLEAVTVTLAPGRVAANGGAGGQGGRGGGSGTNGSDGSLAQVPATGSATNGASGGGGAGSDTTGVASAGADAANGGGGGGGAGRIRINNATATGSYAVLPSIGSSSSVGMVSRTP